MADEQLPPTENPEPVPLKELNPFEVLKRRGAPQPDRDELLRQAAEAPGRSFVLPENETPVGRVVSQEAASAPRGIPIMPLERPRTPELFEKAPEGDVIQAVPEAPRAVVRSAVQVDLPSGPPRPGVLAARSMPVPPNVQSMPLRPAVPVPPGASRRAKLLLAALGAFLILSIGVGGTAYLMAARGTRLPLLSQRITGLKTSGAGQAAAAAAIAAVYPYAGTGTAAVQITKDVDKQKLLTDSGEGAVYRIEAAVEREELTSEGSASLLKVAANGSADRVPGVIVRAGESLRAAFGGTAATLAPLPPVQNLGLYLPLLRRPTPGEVLESLGMETAYRPVLVGGAKATESAYAVKDGALPFLAPEGGSFIPQTAKVSYAWSGGSAPVGAPLATQLEGTLSYGGREYLVSYVMAYGEWGGLGTGEDAKAVADARAAKAGPALSASELSGRFGIAPSNLPNGVASGGGQPATAISPSGKTATAPSAEAVPPTALPSYPATDEMRARDVQRKKDLNDLASAIGAYRQAAGSLPDVAGASEGAQVQASKGLFSALLPKFLTAMPVDPLPGTYYYVYVSSADGKAARVRSVLEDREDPDVARRAGFTYYEAVVAGGAAPQLPAPSATPSPSPAP